jgi:hypothetical protein
MPAGCHFVICHKTLQLVDRYCLVLHPSTAISFTGMRAHTAAGKEEGIPFTDGMDGALVITFTDLCDVERDVDLCRAGLPARCKTLIVLIKVEESFGRAHYFYYSLGACAFAGTAAYTHLAVHHWVAVRSDL